MRLFRDGTTECETRQYDQHFICIGMIKPLQHEMIDDIRMSLSEWTRRHNNWSDAEVRELLSRETAGRLAGRATGNVIEQKRYLRSVYDSFPLFVRPILLFAYRYVLRGGFLDGKEGLIFCVLQTLWFRFLVDAKLYEAGQSGVEPFVMACLSEEDGSSASIPGIRCRRTCGNEKRRPDQAPLFYCHAFLITQPDSLLRRHPARRAASVTLPASWPWPRRASAAFRQSPAPRPAARELPFRHHHLCGTRCE